MRVLNEFVRWIEKLILRLPYFKLITSKINVEKDIELPEIKPPLKTTNYINQGNKQ